MDAAPRDPDSELVERLLHHRAWLSAVARELVRDPSAAEDVAQETLAAALAHPPSGPLRPWLAAVARRAALFGRRGEVNRRAREERAARPEATRSASELVERIEVEERLVRELRGLDEPFRATLLLRYYEGLSAAEIARRDGVPEGTVRWRTSRGIAELCARLERAFGGREVLGLALVPLARWTNTAPLAATAGVGTGGLLMTLGGKAGLAAAGGLALVALTLGYRSWSAGGGAGEAAAAGAVALRPAEPPAEPEAPPALVPAAEASERRSVLVPSAERANASAAVARVHVLETDGTPNADRLVALLADAGGALASQRTDADGWLELAARETPREVVIERVNAFPYRTVLDCTAGQRELVLPEGEVLEGRILVGGGAPPRPIGLDVFPADSEKEQTFLSGADPANLIHSEFTKARTDGDGRFLVRGLRAAQGYNLRLAFGYAHPGSLSVAEPGPGVLFHVPRPTRGLVFEVERYPSVRGRLVEVDGSPARGGIDCRFTWQNGTNMDDGARVGDDGVFELFLRPQQVWRTLELEYWGEPGERGRTSASFDAEGVTDGDLGDLRLVPGRDVRLRVHDKEGRPIAGARCLPLGGPTDERGETLLRQLTTTTLRVAARGHHEQSVALPAQGDTLDVVLARGPELALEVRTADGGAPGEVGVELEAPEPFFDGADGQTASMTLGQDRPGRIGSWGGRPFVARYTTDAEGQLRMDSLRAGVPFTLRVIASGGVALEQRVPALEPEEWRVLPLVLESLARRVRARVVDELGAPLVGVSVRLPPVRSGSVTHNSYARTDGDGWFEALLVPSADGQLVLTRSGFRTLTCPLDDLRDGGPALVLRRGHELTVTVVDEGGLPQAGGELFLHEPEGDSGGACRAVAPGRWTLEGLGESELELELRIGGLNLRRRVPPTADVELRVPVMGAAEVRWDLGDGAELPDWTTVAIRGAGLEPGRVQQSFYRTPRGSQRFEPVLPGTYEVVLVVDEADGELVLARRTIEVRAGETAAVDL